MWKETPVFLEDLQTLSGQSFVPWEELRGKTVLVTGATGLIGYALVCGLLYAGAARELGLQVIAAVRDEARARAKFEGPLDEGLPLRFVEGTVEELPPVEGPVDYIVHGASPTAGKFFTEHPAATIETAVLGTRRLLQLAREKKARGFVYLSSMETYGYPPAGTKCTEEMSGGLNTLEVRNSYPIGKQLCEALCAAYVKEHGVNAMVLRLTQTFGPGVDPADGRVFAEFARCIIGRKDIVLKTKGETERCYLYTMDAVSAILTVLLRGEAGQAYNGANEATFCSIADMAALCAGMAGSRVVFDLQDAAALGYLNVLHSDLDTTRLQALGWAPTRTLKEQFERMAAAMVQP